jgi:hypothetical protein
MNPDSHIELTFEDTLRLVRFMAERGHVRTAYELLAAAIIPRLLSDWYAA